MSAGRLLASYAALSQRSRFALLGWMRKRFAEGALRRPQLKVEKIGSDYGGWMVPTALIKPDWICYCGGVGEDITFDVGLIRRFGCEVFAFDPTPRAITFAAREAAGETRFHFIPVGLWSKDTTMKFFAPRDPAHVSHSIMNLQQTRDYFEGPCLTLSSLMAQLGHQRIDLLKLDIEGAEHHVIRSMLRSGIRPTVLCTEFDQPVGIPQFASTMRRVRSGGYALLAVDDWNFTFVRADALAGLAASGR